MAEPSEMRNKRFEIACRENDLATIDSILSDPLFDPNFSNPSVCALAHNLVCLMNDEAIGRLIRHPLFNPNYHDHQYFNTLGAAIISRNEVAVDLLLKHPLININGTGVCKPPLIVAATSGNLKILKKLLLNSKINLEVADSEGRTALFYAIWYGNIHEVKMLVAAGAKMPIAPLFPGTITPVRLELAKEEWFKAITQPMRTRLEYCKQFNIPDPEEKAAAVFSLVIFLCDDLVCFAPINMNSIN